ncbi:MAG: hypothetical protein CL666_08615 [Balneola sp.]|nr:hypothetical protein [Balneola sp.]|tara:strand:+ start:22839 stop:23273 length:435 start_codon:yes stop_codon:yes gene_type:complete
MSISNKDVRAQFRYKIETVVGIPNEENRAWENKVFEPKKGTPWLREKLLRGDERQSANGELQAVGICQFDYFVPIDSAIYDAEEIADAIKDAFPPGSVLGGLVRIERSRVLSGTKGISDLQQESSSSPWYRIPIRIEYITFSIN